MKKVLLGIVSIFALLFFTSNIASANYYETLNFTDANIGIRIDRVSWNTYELRRTIQNKIWWNVSLTCDILTPDNTLRNVWSCNGRFTYSSSNIWTVAIYINVNWETRTLSKRYDFWRWMRDWSQTSPRDPRNNDPRNDPRNNDRINDLDLVAHNRFPRILDDVDVTVRALRNFNTTETNYRWTIRFSVEYRQFSNSNRTTAPISHYALRRNTYTFNSSNRWEARFNRLINFNRAWTYRLVVQDLNSNITRYLEFQVWWWSQWTDQLDNFRITSSPTNPRINDFIDVTIEARDRNNRRISDYNWRVDFLVQYRLNTSSSRTTANTSDYDLSPSTYTFSTFDNGIRTFRNILRFRRNGQYRLRVRDIDSNRMSYIEYNIWTSSSSEQLDNFRITSFPSSPRINDFTEITIEARDRNNRIITNYIWTVDFRLDYRSNTSSSRNPANTSDGRLNRLSYTFSSFNNWREAIRDLLEFRRNGLFRLTVTDRNTWRSSNIEFNIWWSTSTTNLNRFDVSSFPTNPSRNQNIDLTIRALDRNNFTLNNYRGTVRFTVQQRSLNNRTTAPSNSYTLSPTTYTFSLSDQWLARLNGFIRFFDNWEYRLIIEDRDANITEHIHFNIWVSWSTPSQWFTSSETRQIQTIYNIRPWFISQLERDYPRLRTNTTRQRQQQELYSEMDNILRWRTSIYRYYDEFFQAFRSRYIYTLQVR